MPDLRATDTYQTLLDDGRIRCEICPHACRLADGQRGRCLVRRRAGEAILSDAYGHPLGVGVDPIEKKPLYHFLPGSSAFSFGTLGCNLSCRFCQNWHLSHPGSGDASGGPRTAPEAIASGAEDAGCRVVAFTYNDPVVFCGYAIDAAAACHERDLATVAVTAGYIHGRAREDFFAAMDGVNVDLKAFDDDFYRRQCGVRLAPVLDTLRHVAALPSCWLEITTLLIPGLNDDPDRLREMAVWVYEELGPDVPWHLSAFHPAGELTDRPPTPAETLCAARDIARGAGVRHVYLGNLRAREGGTTRCPSCGRVLLDRDGFAVAGGARDFAGTCPHCGAAIAGVWSAPRRSE